MRNVSLSLVAVLLVSTASAALAEGNPIPNAPVGDGLFGGLVSLWGPFLGIIAALLLFFDRLAKVIPNSTTNKFLVVLQKISTVLGVKVEDKK